MCGSRAMANSRNREAQQISVEWQRGRIFGRKMSLPVAPDGRNQSHVRGRRLDPAFGSLLAKAKRKSWSLRNTGVGFPFKEAGGQPLCNGFARIQTQNPCSIQTSQVLFERNTFFCADHSSAVFTRNAECRVVRSVIDDQYFIAWMQCLEGTSKTQTVIVCVQNCGDQRHGSSDGPTFLRW